MHAGDFEVAMTHLAGPVGSRRDCLRPESIRSMAVRVSAWPSSLETCKSCSGAAAVSLRGGIALCERCRSHMAERLDQMVQPLPVGATVGEPRAADATPRLAGHAIVVDSWSVDLGGFIERVQSQALDRTLRERADLRALWNHDSSVTIGRVSAGTLSVSKDRRGLAFTVHPPEWASSHVETISRGDVTGMSFGFRTVEDEWFIHDGQPARDLLDMIVSEISGVAFPAYPATDVAVQREAARWSPSLKLRERALRVAG